MAQSLMAYIHMVVPFRATYRVGFVCFKEVSVNPQPDRFLWALNAFGCLINIESSNGLGSKGL